MTENQLTWDQHKVHKLIAINISLLSFKEAHSTDTHLIKMIFIKYNYLKEKRIKASIMVEWEELKVDHQSVDTIRIRGRHNLMYCTDE